MAGRISFQYSSCYSGFEGFFKFLGNGTGTHRTVSEPVACLLLDPDLGLKKEMCNLLGC